jgi:hypothetical protein
MRKEGTRFSYANVMSTVAVFLAIGGGALAASTINGKKLKDKSVAGKKLKKNTLTGKQINESKLGKVPKAKQADTATTANTANTATTATTASTADNALQLGGLDPSAYDKTTRVLYGSARTDLTSPQPIFSSSVGNFDLTTDGDADKFTQLRIVNHNSSGNVIGTVFTENPQSATAFGIMAGTAGQIGPATGTGTDSFDTVMTDAGNFNKSVWVHCLFQFTGGNPIAYCWGIQASSP